MLTNDPRRGDTSHLAIEKALRASEYTVATLPGATLHQGRTIYVSNGNAGAPCLAYSNGTSWLRILLGTAVAAS